MKEQLRTGNFYLLDISSFNDLRENYYRSNGKINDVKIRIAALGFFLLNILMGVIGTFWIRTQQRRSEMGLRLALGSTRANLRILLIGEGILLLVLAIVPSAVINANLAIMGILTDTMPATAMRFLVVQSIVFVLIVIMIVIGVCLPAHQVMKIEPAEALHEE